MNELITVDFDNALFIYRVIMEVDGVTYVLFSSVHKHEAEGVALSTWKAVRHLLVIEGEKRTKSADAAHHAVTGE